MVSHSLRPIQTFAMIASLTLPVLAQNPAPQPKLRQASVTTSQPAATFHVYSRAVTLEVIVKDRNHQHVTGLKPEDFQIFEQTPSVSRERSAQKIASFREVHVADLNGHASNLEFPPGFVSNLVSMPKDPVPPTIILVDGLNTSVKDQAQVHRQMLKMLRQIPSNVPVSVYLFGAGLTMLQDFTTDSRLLQQALDKAISATGVGNTDSDPRDDRFAVGNNLGGLHDSTNGVLISNPIVIESIQEFDLRVYAMNMDQRVKRTADALITLGHHLSGYPGRKNLLWLSTTFPMALSPIGNEGPALGISWLGNSTTTKPGNERTDLVSPVSNQDINTKKSYVIDEESGRRSYLEDVIQLNRVLSDAKVAVYPVNVAGVETLHAFQADSKLPDVRDHEVAEANKREEQQIGGEQDTMEVVASGTGGQVCTGDNDLGECVRKAIDDGSQYYEITYNSNSTVWNGKFRRIIVESRQPHFNLAYRQGYYATRISGEIAEDQKVDIATACNNTLNATGIFITARNVPAEVPGRSDFSLAINAEALTFTPDKDGNYATNAQIAVCTYNEKGWAKILMQYPIRESYNPDQYSELLKVGALRQSIYIPGAMPPTARLVVQDIPSGKLGSILIKASDLVANPPKPPGSPN